MELDQLNLASEFDKEKFKAWADFAIQSKAQVLGFL
jgi:hypothetical protein